MVTEFDCSSARIDSFIRPRPSKDGDAKAGEPVSDVAATPAVAMPPRARIERREMGVCGVRAVIAAVSVVRTDACKALYGRINARITCVPRQLDLRAACEAFVAVAERESFTSGATAAGMTQSVASRRVAALEDHLGARLFDRSSRRVELTAFGREVLPSALKLVTAAQELADDADRAGHLTVKVGIPLHADAAAAAHLRAAAAAQGMLVDLLPALPAERAEGLSTGRLELALEHVAPDRATWSTQLGIAIDWPNAVGTDFFFAELRKRRGHARLRRLWLQPEDDVPAIRDRVERVRNGAGLVPSQVRTAASVVNAMSEAIGGDDVVLCAAHEAKQFGLDWRPLGDVHLMRGYAISWRDRELAARFMTVTGSLLATVLQCDGRTTPSPSTSGSSGGGPAGREA